MGDQLHDLRVREMTVTADQDMGVRPVAPEIGQESDHDHGILRAGRALPRPKTGGHQGVRGAFKNEQRQVAMTLVMMVIEGQFLLTMRRVLGVIEVEDNGSRGLGEACNEVVNERLREPVEIRTSYAVFEAGEGWGARQV